MRTEDIKCDYDSDLDIKYFMRPPYETSPYALSLGNDILVMVDEKAENVLGMVFLQYAETVDEFFTGKEHKGHECATCAHKDKCFTRNIKNLLKHKFDLEEMSEEHYSSRLADEIKKVPEICCV